MFLNTSHLNEGGCRDNCSEGRKRELKEGINPKTDNTQANIKADTKLVNAHWQNLRK